MQVSRVNAPVGKCKSIESRQVIKDLVANELVFAVVGPIGSGTSEVANTLIQQAQLKFKDAHVSLIKASEVICRWAGKHDLHVVQTPGTSRDCSLQDAGDAMRRRDAAGVAVQLISEIKHRRTELEPIRDSVSNPDQGGRRFRIFVVDSLKHPAEVALLRRVYQESFCLVGVVCETGERLHRLRTGKYRDSSAAAIDALIVRDERSSHSHGQKVADTFHLADYFVDNTRFALDSEGTTKLAHCDLDEQLERLLDMLTHRRLIRPEPHETGMFHAHGARMRSACLSRQVGAALIDKEGNVVATGTNEVPRAGGGVYDSSASRSGRDASGADGRCAHGNGYCSNTRIGDSIVSELVQSIACLKGEDSQALRAAIKGTAVGQLIEFSRAVHAEMDALLSAARKGMSPVGCRLMVTTFPCHYCARHIICAGIDEVHYIEPYPKSRAFELHGDAMTQCTEGWTAPSLTPHVAKTPLRKVLVRPFVGVAPRLYERAFMKSRSLKNEAGVMHFGEPPWASGLLKLGYEDIEAKLIENGEPQ